MNVFERTFFWLALVGMMLTVVPEETFCAEPRLPPALPNFDQRQTNPPSRPSFAALARLHATVPDAQVHFDSILGSPRWVISPSGFLTGPGGTERALPSATLPKFSANDSNRVIRAFLEEHRDLFGHGAEALDNAHIKREFVAAHNGLRTTVWEQQVDGISVFDALLISHISAENELVSVSSHFVLAPVTAADATAAHRAFLESSSPLTASQALLNASRNIGESITPAALSALPSQSSPERRQMFTAPALKGNAVVRLIWLPLNRNSLRLSWEVILMSRARDQMFRVLIDAKTGMPLLRQCLTDDISDASYRVFTSFSPTPFISPSNSLPTIMGYSSPQTNQPPEVSRVLVVTNALDTNASPCGWINDGSNTTAGNNVFAQLGRSGSNPPRPSGSPFRVFDFPLDLTLDPITYSNTCVVNLFYWCNWMHDRLYDLGFTEAAGNFQADNFGRGGMDNDPVEADAQDGGGFNNAHFTTPPDGMSGIMQVYLFTGPTPNRDADFDNEVILHEYTHGMSNRRVGGGVGITALQSLGLGEGWSDFYSLALSSQASDDPNACYPEGPYATYLLNGLTQNYYFGVRRYPYSTSLTNCPGTFADIDPSQASSHPGVPLNPSITNSAATEIHNQGEIWCDALWDARANLISQYGFATGNQLIMQLVADGMDLTPANPDFVEARDAIIQADLIDTGGQNYQALWRAFAKRGLGWYAIAPNSSTTSGVTESYVVPDNLLVLPATDFASSGSIGSPFTPAYSLYALKNTGTNILNWAAGANVPWINISATNGSLVHLLDSTNIVISLNATANALPVGNYSGSVSITNLASGFVQTRNLSLSITEPAVHFFALDSDPGWSRQGQWAFGPPLGQGGTSHGFPDPSSGATGANVFGVNLSGDYSTTPGGPYYLTTGPLNFTGVQETTLAFQRWLNSDTPPYAFANVSVSNDGTNWNSVFDNSAGVIMDSAWTNCTYDISAYADNQPTVYVRWGYRVASSAFAFSGWNIDDIGFLGVNQLSVSLPASATEGAGVLATLGNVFLQLPAPATLTVTLASSDPSTLVVPSFVTIPAGQTNSTFNITLLDDGVLDGTRPVEITASAPGCSPASNAVIVFDIETTTLSVTIPATANEGDGTISGTVTMIGTPAENITVILTSSDPGLLAVPTNVVIPLGQSSINFNATVENLNRINGNKTVTVTAHVHNWTNGTVGINVQYPQSSNLVLNLLVQARESNGLLTNAGMLTIPGVLSSNLVVSLISSNTSKLLVPPTVTILAGQTSVVFNLTTVAGNAPAMPVSVFVSASAAGFTIASAAINIIDNQTPPAPFNPMPPNLSTTNPVNVTLSWSPGLGEGTETVFNGGFESGNFAGWNATTNFVINNGSIFPPSGDGATFPFDGNFSALAEPFPPAASLLYQDIPLPTNAGTITLSWVDRIRNFNTDFETNQLFRVEIRNTNNSTLATVYVTRPADPLLNDWVQRSADISVFAGQTIRLAFIVNADLNFLDVHLDDVSVRCAHLPPVTYSVYFGTDAVPGPSDFLGNTTNTFWALPKLTPLTNYFWQIVASRTNQAPGPIWQFSSLPTLFITNASLQYNTNGMTNLVFSVRLSDVGSNLITVNFATADGTATAPADYVSTNGTLMFNPGQTNQTISIPINFNTNLPLIKTFTISLSNPINAALGNVVGLGTINDINPLAPVVAAISNQTVHARITVSFFVTATNANNDPMLFSLDSGAPTNAVINSTNGLFSWTPGDTNIGLYTITVRATDTSVPTLSGTQTFTINVFPRPTITSIQISGGHANLAWSAIPGGHYRLQSNTNLIGAWASVPGDITATNTTAAKIDPAGLGATRFYRTLVLP